MTRNFTFKTYCIYPTCIHERVNDKCSIVVCLWVRCEIKQIKFSFSKSKLKDASNRIDYTIVVHHSKIYHFLLRISQIIPIKPQVLQITKTVIIKFISAPIHFCWAQNPVASTNASAFIDHNLFSTDWVQVISDSKVRACVIVDKRADKYPLVLYRTGCFTHLSMHKALFNVSSLRLTNYPMHHLGYHLMRPTRNGLACS